MATQEQIIQFKVEIADIEKVQGEFKIKLCFLFGQDVVEDAIELNAVNKLMDYKIFADNYFRIPIPSFRCWYFNRSR